MTADNHSPMSKTKLTISSAANFKVKEQQVDNISDMTYYKIHESTLQLQT
jgi:hypothetical protein